MEHNLFMYL